MGSRTEQACLWIAKMDAGALSAVEKQRLRQWLQEDVENRNVLRRVRELWAALDLVGEMINCDADFRPEDYAAALKQHHRGSRADADSEQ